MPRRKSRRNVANKPRFEVGRPSISNVYNGKSILITGGSGFLGKVLLEKILRSCSNVRNVYVLMRPDFEAPSERLTKILQSFLFDEVRFERRNNPSIIPVSGDVAEPDFGMSNGDLAAIRNNVDFVFHCAAVVRYNADMRNVLNVNFLGAKYALELCRTMKKLKAFVHVSTAYSFCNLPVVEESVNPPPGDIPENIFDLVEQGAIAEFEEITKDAVKSRPSLYHYSKAMSEKYIVDRRGKVPIVIIRPSIMTGSYEEPIPGWIDNYNGASGLISACSNGVIRAVHAYPDVYADWIPVDIVANTLIAAAYYMAVVRPADPFIVNCTSSITNPLTWGEVERIVFPLILKYPSMELRRYPGGSFKKYHFSYIFSTVIHHWLPAYIMDLVTTVMGRTCNFVEKCECVHKTITNFQYFTTHKIELRSENTTRLINFMREEDKVEFLIDVQEVEWNSYTELYVLGIRRYVECEPDSSLPAARRKLRRLKLRSNMAKLSLLASPILLGGMLYNYWFQK